MNTSEAVALIKDAVEQRVGRADLGADCTRPLVLPVLDGAPLDGILLANALHFVRDAAADRVVGSPSPYAR